MSDPAKTTVLISELAAMSSQRVYLPYVWGILRSHVEQALPGLRENIDWLPPLFGARPPREALRGAGAERVDVLGLSCYTWNWDAQRQLAREAKAANPDCLVVAGGPQPDAGSPDFFRRHPYIDAVVVNDGEIPFARIVETVCAGERDVSGIPGVVVPGPGQKPGMVLDPVKPVEFSRSPFVEYADVYERIVRENPGISTVLETNRGCPYRCSFCDWGSNTMSKVRAFEIERVRADARWVFSQPLFMVMLADANFGILPRDVEIARLYAELHGEGGGPRFFYYSPAKNAPGRTTEIARTFAHAGLANSHPIAVQHTDPKVLAATDRANISIEKQRDVIRELTHDAVPLAAQLILGIPGDTVSKWAQVFADLIEWGVHDRWTVSDYALLPNAPAAAPAFLARWQVETARRPAAAHGRSRPKGDRRGVCTMDLIVASRTFSREDWVHMRTYAAIVTALHNAGFTRRIAQYLRFSHDVAYRSFYDAVVLDFVRTRMAGGAWWRRVHETTRGFLADADAPDTLDCDELPALGLDLRHEDWVMLEVALHRDTFFDGLADFLCEAHPAAPGLRSVIDYQRQLVITADYDPKRGRRFESAHEWSAYFEEIDRLVQYEPRPEPAAARPGTVFEITDTATGARKQQALTWATDPSPDAAAHQLAWARGMVAMERAAACQCFDLPARVRAPHLRLRATIA